MMGSRARVVVLLLVVFAAGTAAGVAADRLDLMPDVARAEDGESGLERPAGGRRMAQRQTTIERSMVFRLILPLFNKMVCPRPK